MYKDKEKQKEYDRGRKRKAKVGKGVGKDRVGQEGRIKEPWYPNKQTDEYGRPIIPKVLSDGQLWYPKP